MEARGSSSQSGDAPGKGTAKVGKPPANIGSIPPPPPQLTKREREVGRLISLGCTVAEAACILFRSPNTVDNHKSAAMRKLGTRNLATFTRRIIQLGISDLNDQLSTEELERLQKAQQERPPRKKAKPTPPEKPR